MKKGWLCKLGCHIWYDAVNIHNEAGCFEIQKCMHCQDYKVYKRYSLCGQGRLHLLSKKEIPQSVLRDLKEE